MADVVGLVYAKAVECMSSAESVWHVGVSVNCYELLLLLNMAHMVVLYVEGC